MESITTIAQKYKTDKGVEWIHNGVNIAHGYSVIYDNMFKDMRELPLNILEIGLGDDAGSAYLWAEVFPNAQIYMADYDRNKLQRFSNINTRVHVKYVDQSNQPSIKNLANEVPEMDLIIDDGSHYNDHIIKSFQELFPKLKKGGMYIIEDTYQSYTEGGFTTINFFKDMIDMINDYLSTKPDVFGITSIQFHRNLIIVYKGDKITK